MVESDVGDSDDARARRRDRRDRQEKVKVPVDVGLGVMERGEFLIASTIIPKSREAEIPRPVSVSKHTPSRPSSIAASNTQNGHGGNSNNHGCLIDCFSLCDDNNIYCHYLVGCVCAEAMCVV